jgi:hypothetical protein
MKKSYGLKISTIFIALERGDYIQDNSGKTFRLSTCGQHIETFDSKQHSWELNDFITEVALGEISILSKGACVN